MTIPPDAAGDEQLIERTRAGDMAAYDELYRRHVDDATKVARIITNNSDEAQDIVAEAFTRVLTRLREGGGPDTELTPYLRTVVRRLAIDRHRTSERSGDPSDPSVLEVLPRTDDPMARSTDRQLVRHAFETLPERWQQVLWHTEIEGRSAASLAPALGSSPNAVAALAYRAREGLRQAYLAVNLSAEVPPECRSFAPKVASYVRGTLSAHDTREMTAHLSHCAHCRERRDELLLLVSDMRGVLWPALLLPASAAATAAVVGAAGTGGGVVAFLSPAAWGRRAKQLAATSAGVAAAGIIAVSAYLLVSGAEPDDTPQAVPSESSESDTGSDDEPPPSDSQPDEPPVPEPDEPAASQPDDPESPEPDTDTDAEPPSDSQPDEAPDDTETPEPPTTDDPDEPTESPDPTSSPDPSEPPEDTEPPTITVQPPSNPVVVAGQVVKLRVEIEGDPKPQLQWQYAAPQDDAGSDGPDSDDANEAGSDGSSDGSTAQPASDSDPSGTLVAQFAGATVHDAAAGSPGPATWEPDSWFPTALPTTLLPLPEPGSTSSASPGESPTPSPTATNPTNTPTSTPTSTPTNTSTPDPTATPDPTPTSTATQSPSPDPTTSAPPDPPEPPDEQDWVNIKGATSETLVIRNVTAEDDGRAYRLLATNPAGTVATEPTVVSVRYKPEIAEHPDDVRLDEGETATFEAAAVGKPEKVTASWQVREPRGEWRAAQRSAQVGAGPKAQTTTTSLEISQVPDTLDGFEYRAVFANDVGTTVSKPARLTVRYVPEVTDQPSDVEVYVGEDATFTAVSSARPKASSYWETATSPEGPWTRVEGSGGGPEASLTVPGAGVDDGGALYRAVFTNDLGTATSEPAELSVRFDGRLEVDLNGAAEGGLRCVQPVDGDVAVGDCGAAAARGWHVSDDGVIRYGTAATCLDATGGVVLAPCDDSTSQLWGADPADDGFQVIERGGASLVGFVLDVEHVDPDGKVTLFPYHGGFNQLFRYVP